MNVQSKILLRSIIRHLVQSLELLNTIDEKDYAEIVKKAKLQKNNVKGVLDNAGRGNIFMMIFFIRELIENILNQ
jgi:hypothetical protein